MRLLLFIAFIIPSTLIAQFGNQDFGIWAGASANKEVVDGLKVDADLQFRTDDNSTRLNKYFIDLGVKYKVNKYFRVGTSWRPRMVNGKSGFVFQNRLYLDLTGKLKLNDVSLYVRNRIQTTSNRNSENPSYNRIRLKAKVKIDKGLKVFVQDEFFFHLNGVGVSNYKKNRFGFGLEYAVNKAISLSVKYLRITEVNQYYPLRMNVIAIGLSYSID